MAEKSKKKRSRLERARKAVADDLGVTKEAKAKKAKTRAETGARVQRERGERQAAIEAADDERRQEIREATERGEHSGFEYRVDQIRETLVGDKIKTDELQKLLTKRAAEGWRLRNIVEASVGGRIGPGGTGGLVVVFEREA